MPNTSFGTYVQDGVRSGPVYSNNFVGGLVADANGNYGPSLTANTSGTLFSGGNQTYGPGVLYSPINTYNIVPAVGSFSNIVAHTLAAELTSETDLLLTGDNVSAFYANGVVQLDWPRIPVVTTIGNQAGLLRVTIFGTDWYDVPLQHTYLITVAGNYPSETPIIYNDQGVSTAALLNPVFGKAKAFYKINRIYINTGLTAGTQITIGASDLLGFPYFVNDFSDVISLSQGPQSEIISSSVLVNGTLRNGPLIPRAVFVGGDATFPATAFSGDVRGIYNPQGLINGSDQFKLTSYVSGADVFQNQIAAAQNLATTNGAPLIGAQVNPLNQANLYGVPQFYTGVPS